VRTLLAPTFGRIRLKPRREEHVYSHQKEQKVAHLSTLFSQQAAGKPSAQRGNLPKNGDKTRIRGVLYQGCVLQDVLYPGGVYPEVYIGWYIPGGVYPEVYIGWYMPGIP